MSEMENSLEANAETQLAAVPMPRLGISHLMLWTLCYALYLVVIPAAYAMFGSQTDLDVLGGIVKGAVFAGVITLIWTRVRGEAPLLKQPGHWLLFISAIYTLIGTPVFLLVGNSLALANPLPGLGSWQFVTLHVLQLFQPIAFAFAASRIRVFHWKVLFVTMFLVDLPKFLYFLGIELPLADFSLWARFVPEAAMMVVSIVETKSGLRRDWLHWTGVTTQLASWSNPILWVLS